LKGSSYFSFLQISVPNPNKDPDPQDPHVFGPPGSGPLVKGMDPDPHPSINKQKK
jgi:hypothetical protein